MILYIYSKYILHLHLDGLVNLMKVAYTLQEIMYAMLSSFFEDFTNKIAATLLQSECHTSLQKLYKLLKL